MAAPQPNTKRRIQDIALELFTEQGYDGTSLREIAERLGVTKAALYYHFKSKDEIIVSLFEEMKARIEALVAWAKEQEFSVEFQREFLSRMADLFFGEMSRYVRLLQENGPVLRSILEDAASEDDKELGPGAWTGEVVGLLTPPDADLYVRTKTRTAVMSIVFGSFAPQELEIDRDATTEERRAASLAVAQLLIVD